MRSIRSCAPGSRTSSCVCSASRQDGRVRDTRHRRGDQGRRPHRDPPQGRAARAVRHARDDPRAPRRRLRRGVRRRRPRRSRRSRCTRSPSSSSAALETACGRRRRDHAARRALAADRRAGGRARCDGRRRARARLGRRRTTCSGERARRRAPVIPNFGQGSSCEQANGWFCTDWLHAHWGDTLQPALIQHIWLTLIAVGCGFAISFALALIGFPLPPARRAARRLQRLPLHDPEPGALPAARADHRSDRDDGGDRARLLHAADPLPQHRRGPARRSGGRARGGARDGVHAGADVPACRAAARRASDRRRPAYRDGLDDLDCDRGRARAAERARPPDLRRARAEPLQDRDPRGRRARGRARARAPTRCWRWPSALLTPWSRGGTPTS